MQHRERFELLMKEVGSVVDAESVVQFEQDNWVVEVNENLLIWLRYHKVDDSFTLSSEVGAVLAEDKLAFYEFLLVFNSLSLQQKMVKVALDSDKENVLILADFSVESLTTQYLANLLRNIAEQQVQWSKIVELWPTVKSAEQQVLAQSLVPFTANMMKV